MVSICNRLIFFPTTRQWTINEVRTPEGFCFNDLNNDFFRFVFFFVIPFSGSCFFATANPLLRYLSPFLGIRTSVISADGLQEARP